MQTYDPRYLDGIAHFNRGEYFEAHEAWEQLWIHAQDPARLFYKGLIQAAVALHHASQGNRHGAWKLYQRSRCVLTAYEPWYLGLNVERFIAEFDLSLCSPGAYDAASPPGPSGPQIELAPLGNGSIAPALRPILKESCWPRPESPT